MRPVGFTLVVLLALALPAAAEQAAIPGDGPWIVRAYDWTEETVRELGTYFEHLGVYREKGMLLIFLDNRQELDMLLEKGLRVEVDGKQTATLRRLEAALAAGVDSISSIPGFECYRLVEETMADAEALAAAYPDLATYIDVGDSWEKTQPGGLPGYDLKVLKLTNSAIPGDKPVALFFGSTHAREYTTSELVTRFGEWMLASYGVDPDVTWVLDHHEVHLLLYMNPDGRKKAETGLLWRKNTDNDDGCSDPNSWGVDLNRNWDFMWNCCGGSSGSPCSATYRGPSAASEPENQAAQAYKAFIFPDQRPDDLVTPAPPDSEGLFIDFHSYGGDMFAPWSFYASGCDCTPHPCTQNCAPNWQGLLTLARKYTYSPGYTAALGSTGPIDGASKDYSYGRLGVPGYTVELGTQFFEPCPNFENIILPDNMPSMMQMAKSVRLPYIEPGGPDVLDPAVPPVPVAAGALVELTAVADDTRFGPQSTLSPPINPTQAVTAAQVYVDTPWWNGGTPIAMAASDGAFDETVEDIEATLDTTGLAPGRHMLFVRALDASDAYGASSGAFLYVIDPATSPTLQGFVTDGMSGAPLAATVEIGPFQVAADPGSGAYALQVPPGTYDVTAAAAGYAPQTEVGVVLDELQTVELDFRLQPLMEIFADDVESGNPGWIAQTPWAITDEASSSPTHSWADSPGGNYANNADTSLTSPVFDLTDLVGAVLSFSHIYDFEAGFDSGTVEVSTNGSTWTAVEAYSQEGQTGTWIVEQIPLPQLDGSPTAQFRFRVQSDGGVTRDGWHVDDILLQAAASNTIFADGFESGDTSAWTVAVP